MSKATIQGLKDFVNTQPPEKVILHATWDSCAVGDYAASIQEPTDQVVRTLYQETGSNHRSTAHLYRVHHTEHPTLMDQLNLWLVGNTYGELQEAIK